MSPRVVGIDPSLTATGYANGATSFTTITYPSGCAGDQRLYELSRWIYTSVRTYKPDLVVIEDLPQHARSAGLTGMVQGVIRIALIDLSTRYVSLPAATLKRFATGRGNATKADMRLELYKRAGLDVRDDNQVDARWLYEAGMHLLGAPTMQLPKTHTDALKKVQLP